MGNWRSWLARFLDMEEVTGSNPVLPTEKNIFFYRPAPLRFSFIAETITAIPAFSAQYLSAPIRLKIYVRDILSMKKTLLFALLLLGAGCGKKNDENVIIASGTIETTEVNIAAKSPGQLISLRVDEGTVVHAGDIIGVIDTTTYALGYRQMLA